MFLLTFAAARRRREIHALSVEEGCFPYDCWICDIIKLAYADSSDLSFMKISAHEVRALSSSWAYWNSVALEDVVRAAYSYGVHVPIALFPHFISEIWPQLDKIHHLWDLSWLLSPLLAVIYLSVP